MTTAARIGLASLAATALAVATAARGFTEFQSVRVKLVESAIPAAAGEVRVSTAGKPRVNALSAPIAVIARLHNGTGARQRFSIDFDGRPVCEVSVDANSAPAGDTRVDCAASGPLAGTPDHELRIRGPDAAWSLDYLELSTHHGGSSGGFFIIPAAASTYGHPGAEWVVPMWCAMFVLIAFVGGPVPRPVVVLSRIAAGAAALVFAGAMLAPWVSPYRVILSTGTLIRAALVLVVAPLWVMARWIMQRATERWADWAPIGACALVALVVGWGYETVMARQLQDFYHGNYSGLLDIARDTYDRNPELSGRDDIRRSLLLKDGGYDGQFMYFAAFDPFLLRYHDDPGMYRRVMDAPPYRFGRIGFSLLTKIFSLDRWQLYPATMIWLILAGIASCAFLIGLVARANGATPAWGLVVLLIPGFWMSIESGLPEPIAAATALAGYWFATRRRWLPATACFAVSLLVRETGVVLLVAVGVLAFRSGSRRQALMMTALALAPIVIWRLYVGWTLFPDWGWHGFAFNPHDLGAPFGGFINLWRAVAAGTYPRDLWRAAIVYPILITTALALSVVFAVRRPGAVTLATVCYAVVAVSLNYAAIWVHVGNGQRGTFEVFTWLAVTSAAVGRPTRLERLSVLSFWALAAFYVFYGSFEAAFVRTALF